MDNEMSVTVEILRSVFGIGLVASTILIDEMPKLGGSPPILAGCGRMN